MVPGPCSPTAPVPPPAYHRAQAQAGPALHLDALRLVRQLHLLALCRLAVQMARWRCPQRGQRMRFRPEVASDQRSSVRAGQALLAYQPARMRSASACLSAV
jgi:hypothetical protein